MIENFRHWALVFVRRWFKRGQLFASPAHVVSPTVWPEGTGWDRTEVEPGTETFPEIVKAPEGLSQAISRAVSHALSGARRAPKVSLKLKTSILDQLDDNTKIIGRMQKYFPTEYGMYSQLGAVIIPHDEKFLYFKEIIIHPASPWFQKVRPAFGAVVTGNPHDEKKGKDEPSSPRLIHFLKIKHPKELRSRMFSRDHLTIQPIAHGSDFYIFTLYYDQRDWALAFPKKTKEERRMCKFFERAFAVELPVEITKDGVIRPLKIKSDRLVKKVGYLKRWDYPFSKEWIGSIKSGIRKLTQEQFHLMHVGFALHCYEEGNASMIQVRAAKNGVVTLINVNVETTPSFFDDREDVIIDGIKKRIFHIVRPHQRFLGNRVADVHLHFRGLRQFIWNGYEISISVPGRDHFDHREFDLTARQDLPKNKGHDMADVATWLVANQKNRAGAWIKPGPMIPMAGWDRKTPPPPANPG